MRNTRKINLGRSRYLVIDLTEPLKEDTKVYPGDPKPEKKIFSDIHKTGYQHHIYKIGDHQFHPHGDAPKHQNIDLQNRGFEFFGLDYCFNHACLVDLSTCDDAKRFGGIEYVIEVKEKHLEPFKELVSNRGAVIIRTGYDRWLEENKDHIPRNIPYLNKTAAKFLSDFDNLKVIGIDSLTIDPCGKSKPVHFSHQTLRDKLIVESMVNLHQIPINDRDGFDLQTSPVRIVGATGGPIVAYAFIEL